METIVGIGSKMGQLMKKKGEQKSTTITGASLTRITRKRRRATTIQNYVHTFLLPNVVLPYTEP